MRERGAGMRMKEREENYSVQDRSTEMDRTETGPRLVTPILRDRRSRFGPVFGPSVGFCPSLNIGLIGLLKSSISRLIKPGKNDFYNFKSSKNYKMSGTKMLRLIKQKKKAFHDKYISRRTFNVHEKVWLYNSHLKLFLGQCALGGMVHMTSLKHLKMDRS